MARGGLVGIVRVRVVAEGHGAFCLDLRGRRRSPVALSDRERPRGAGEGGAAALATVGPLGRPTFRRRVGAIRELRA